MREVMGVSEKALKTAASIGEAPSSEKRVVQTKAHRAELAKVLIARDVDPSAIHIGSTGIQLLLRHGNELGQKIAPTEDADVVMSQRRLERLAERYGAEIQDIHLIAQIKTKIDTVGEPTEIVENDPFILKHLSTVWTPGQTLLDNLDIFTDATGVGVIPVTPHVLREGFDRVPLGDTNVRVAKPFFLVATQLNPFARTPARTSRMVFVMLQSFRANPEGFEAEIAKGLRYIDMGGQRAEELALADPALQRRVEFAEYDSQVRKVANIVGIQLKKKIKNAAGRLELTTAEAQIMIDTVADLFRGYETTKKERVVVHDEGQLKTPA